MLVRYFHLFSYFKNAFVFRVVCRIKFNGNKKYAQENLNANNVSSMPDEEDSIHVSAACVLLELSHKEFLLDRLFIFFINFERAYQSKGKMP